MLYHDPETYVQILFFQECSHLPLGHDIISSGLKKVQLA